MDIQYVSRLVVEDEGFTYKGTRHTYEEIASISFVATATKHSVNFVPTGTTYEADLRVQLTNGGQLRIKPDSGFFRSGTQKARMEALWRAKEYLSELSFTSRIGRSEKQIEERAYFSYGDYNFHKAGDVFKREQRLFSVFDKTISVRLGPFQLHFVREKTGLQKLGSLFVNLDVIIDISTDRDCVLYMMKRLYGMAWPDERIREKRVDPRRLFTISILKLGAAIAKADGRVDAAEVQRLKSHFSITSGNFPEAGKIFNEALSSSETPASIAQQIVSVTRDNREFREWILIGLCLMAAADGAYGRAEHMVIAAVAGVFGFSRDDLAHVLALAGIEPEKPQETPSATQQDVLRLHHLRVLGLAANATFEEIKIAYRTLAKQHHPDTLQAHGVPIAEIRLAEEVLKNINGSYNWLRARYAA